MQNMINFKTVEGNREGSCTMDKTGKMILTGWGYAEYVASAAVVLKALRGRADVYEKYGENLTRAAEALDVSRNTVRKYL